MKLNLEYLNENHQDELTPIESETIDRYLLSYSSEQYKEILQNDTRVEVALALSPLRKNILNWYPFKKGSTILEIQANLGEVTGLLCEKANKVVAIENNLKKAEAISKRHETRNNLEIIVGNIEEIPLEEKFDYGIIYEPQQLTNVIKYIKPNGKILLATNNRFGISYFAGACFQGKIYDTILNEAGPLFGKKEIEQLLNKEGIKNYQFYYPLPNYQIPNVIFSEEYMPNENTTKLMYNIMYEKGSVVVFDELKALKQVTKNGLFDFFANSYLVEICPNEETPKTPIRFVSFNNNRKEEYQLATLIYPDKVKKEIMNQTAKKHIKYIELNTKNLKKLGFEMIDDVKEEEIISRYIQGDTFDKKVVKLLLQGEIETACFWIQKWYEHIKEKLLKNKRSTFNENIVATPEELEGLTILKNGYIDLVFENTFYQENQFLFFDQEWYADGIPIEFLLYRAIQNMYAYNLEIEKKYPRQNMLERFGLSSYTNLFQRIEEYLQKDIIDDAKISLNQQSLDQLHDINYTSILINKIKDFEENDIKQNQYIHDLESENSRKESYIKQLEIDNQNKQQYIQDLETLKTNLEQQIKEIEKKGKGNFFKF